MLSAHLGPPFSAVFCSLQMATVLSQWHCHSVCVCLLLQDRDKTTTGLNAGFFKPFEKEESWNVLIYWHIWHFSWRFFFSIYYWTCFWIASTLALYDFFGTIHIYLFPLNFNLGIQFKSLKKLTIICFLLLYIAPLYIFKFSAES